jgi:predicted phosphodiesterase
MIALLSDIHANLEALTAVLADIEGQNVDAIYCLGDTLGYGPDPAPCLDVVMRFPVVLLGNHDYAVLHDPDGFCASAEQAVNYHQNEIERAVGPGETDGRHWPFLERLLPRHEENGVLFVHGSPRNPLNEYLFPEDIDNAAKMTRNGELFRGVCFAGHTHIPGVFVEDAPGRWGFRSPVECRGTHRFDGRNTVVNVGAVGQPRDADWRACYALFDGETVRFRRVEYDVGSTVAKIARIAELADFLGERLTEGR